MESSIFTQKEPSQAPSDPDKSWDNDSGDENIMPMDERWANSGAPTDMKVSTSRGQGPSYRTGPKGVVADYKEAQETMKARLLNEKIEHERILNRMAVGDERFIITQQQNAINKRSNDNDDDSEEEEGSDDEAFELYKANRLRVLQENQPGFGTVKEVTTSVELAGQLGQSGEGIISILHLYQPTIEECVRLNYALDNMASQFIHVRFLRAIATNIIPNFKDVGLPTLLVYEDELQIMDFIKVTKHIGLKFTDRDLFHFLVNKNILVSPES